MNRLGLAVLLGLLLLLVPVENAPAAQGKCPPGGLPDSSACVAQAKCRQRELIQPCTAYCVYGKSGESGESSGEREHCSCTPQSSPGTQTPAPATSASTSEPGTPPTSASGESGESTVSPSGSTDSSAAPSYPPTGETSTSAPGTTATAAPTSASPTEAPEPFPCQLIYELKRIKYAYLTIVEQDIFEILLIEIRAVLVCSCSDDEKLVKIGKCWNKFAQDYKSIHDKIKFKRIHYQDGTDFGDCNLFQRLCVVLLSDQISGLFTPLDASPNGNGDSNYTLALQAGTAQDQCGPGSGALVAKHIVKAKRVCQEDSPNYNQPRKLGWCHDSFVLDIDSTPYGPAVRNFSVGVSDHKVDDFLNVCAVQGQGQSQPNDTCAGPSEQTPIIKGLRQGISDALASNSTDNVTASEGQQFCDYISGQFQLVVDVVVRIQILVTKFSTLSDNCRDLLKPITIIGLSYQQYSFGDLVLTGGCCANGYACGNQSTGPPSKTPVEACNVDQATNNSDIYVACQNWYYSLPSVYKTSFAATLNYIYKALWFNQNNLATALYQVAKNISICYTNQPSMRAQFLATPVFTIFVPQPSGNYTYANLGTICGCH